jgi:hypothetical protein
MILSVGVVLGIAVPIVAGGIMEAGTAGLVKYGLPVLAATVALLFALAFLVHKCHFLWLYMSLAELLCTIY